MLRAMMREGHGRYAPAAVLAAAVLAGCGGDGGPAPDPTCCERIYPEWCERFAECDPVTFSLSWRDAAGCTSEQVAACRAGRDTEALCVGRTTARTEACRAALDAATCDELFGSAGLPAACSP